MNLHEVCICLEGVASAYGRAVTLISGGHGEVKMSNNLITPMIHFVDS